MAKRKAFSLRWILVPYNFSMALLNLYIALEVFALQTDCPDDNHGFI